jgi:mono/diheme cytochrome c family protein
LRAACVGSVLTLAGCGAEEPAPQGAGGGGGSAGSNGNGYKPSFTYLTGDSAALSMTPAPAEYTKTCQVCHGSAGQGISPIGPEIRHAPPTYFNWVVRNGRAGSAMLAFPVTMIPDTTLAEIQAWLAGLPKPMTGEQLYLDFCGNCHGPMGSGGGTGTAVQHKVKADLNMRVRMGEGTDPSMRYSYMPPESPTELTDPELELINAYLMSN